MDPKLPFPLSQIVGKARDAAHGQFGVLSTGEKLAAALVLNRPDWLDNMGYTLIEAIQRVGPEWMALLPRAYQILDDEELVSRRPRPQS